MCRMSFPTIALIVVCCFALKGAGVQGPNEIQTHGKVCGNPVRPCPAGRIFSDADLSFVLPSKLVWQRNYYSATFYAVILKSKTAVEDEGPDTDNCKRGFFSESERRGVQSLFPTRKVFASEYGCYLPKIVYTNTKAEYNFLAVYAGVTASGANAVLTQVKASGQFPRANIRKMRVVFSNGD